LFHELLNCVDDVNLNDVRFWYTTTVELPGLFI